MSSDLQKPDGFTEGKIVLIDKPYGWTSYNVVSKVRHLLKKYKGLKKIKVGHAGTLDPLATGLLVICIGKATKQVNTLIADDKEYIAKLRLGETTPSFDLETQCDQQYPTSHITRERVDRAIIQLLGDQMQIPPLFSAKCIQGKRAYKFARKGVEMELDPVPIRINSMEVIEFELPFLTVKINCSKGTYIRALARDIGRALESGAHLVELHRTGSGPFSITEAITLEIFEKNLMGDVTN